MIHPFSVFFRVHWCRLISLWIVLSIPLLFFVILILREPTPVMAGGVVGDGTPGSCTESAFVTALAGGGSVTFNCGASPITITLTSQKAITANTTIDGNSLITLDGNASTRVFVVYASASLNLANITIGNGATASNGAGIWNDGMLTVDKATFVKNNPSPSQSSQGGAIYSTNMLTITNSTFSGNYAGYGGAIYVSNGTAFIASSYFITNTSINNTDFYGAGGALFNSGPAKTTIMSSTFAANTSLEHGGSIYNSGNMTITGSNFVGGYSSQRGGALYNLAGGLVLASSTVSNNVAVNGGGGIFNSLGKLTIAGGSVFSNAATFGGGISNGGTVTLTGLLLASNKATTDGGGVMNNGGTILIRDSLISDNKTTSGGGNGGGAINNWGTLTITNSTLMSNTTSVEGGAIRNSIGNLTILSSTLSYNSAGTTGGAIASFDATSNLTVRNSTLVGNHGGNGGDFQGGGAIYNAGHPMTITNSTLANNVAAGSGIGGGGGILTFGVQGTLRTIENTLFYGNSASGTGGGGGIVVRQGDIIFTNTTFSNNSAIGGPGGGIDQSVVSGTLRIVNSTFMSNTATTGGSLSNEAGAPVSVTNTILAFSAPTNCSGSILSLGYNLDSANSCGLNATGDMTNTNPLLALLANNGGPTLTHALSADSPAVNKIPLNLCIPYDQRGYRRPQGAGCDIGAYELIFQFIPVLLQNASP